MRVETLIKKLQKMDPKANVCIADGGPGGIMGSRLKVKNELLDPDGAYVTPADKGFYDARVKFEKAVVISIIQ